MIGKVLIETTIPMVDFGRGQSPYPFMFVFTQDKNETFEDIKPMFAKDLGISVTFYDTS
ncbi:hypothetical protein [Segetibacter aerophilus]|uniref:Uncharacterized protein n=1 Tax=Segetibacter aerophilus TaxID=670293 RepID=A0A512B6F3_9BACT|nr:hypothetical protein [Segetibacter aerophilus]GEO07551.1 hypothetical protein SAE01_00470 [Segetibacter aerophilus]